MSMTRGFEILPAIDLRGGRVVRLQQGDFARESVFADDPVDVARQFVNGGARWLHVVDLDGARTGTPAQSAIIDAIARAVGLRARIEVAGGLRDESAIDAALSMGAARVVLGTMALSEPQLVARLIAGHRPERIAVAIDVRRGVAVGRGWSTEEHGVDVDVALRRLAGAGVETFEVTAIERDGLLEGPDLALYERVVRLDLGAVIASGGISTIDDLRALCSIGCAGAIIGRALYEGRFELVDAIAMSAGDGEPIAGCDRRSDA
jgi:phosphoribosylformimino-5-aminoimidazole carboxamide ribotide isomerase